jgi:hypothetical protein
VLSKVARSSAVAPVTTTHVIYTKKYPDLFVIIECVMSVFRPCPYPLVAADSDVRICCTSVLL